MLFDFDDEKGKLFVGGLSWDSNYFSLYRYFIKFGKLVDCVVMKNNITQTPRGFGFVKFQSVQVAKKVLESGPHCIDGRRVDIKPCAPRNMQYILPRDNVCKMFIGGLPPDCTETDIRDVFEKYGEVTEVVIMYDHVKKRPRGFGFVSFKYAFPSMFLSHRHYMLIKGRRVEIKLARPRPVNQLSTYKDELMDGLMRKTVLLENTIQDEYKDWLKKHSNECETGRANMYGVALPQSNSDLKYFRIIIPQGQQKYEEEKAKQRHGLLQVPNYKFKMPKPKCCDLTGEKTKDEQKQKQEK